MNTFYLISGGLQVAFAGAYVSYKKNLKKNQNNDFAKFFLPYF